MMKRILGIILLVLCVVPLHQVLAAGDPNDMAGSKDPDLFSRMPGFYIYNYQELDFNRYEFPVSPGKTKAMEGRHYHVDYYANEGIKLPSGLQVTRNYANAARAVGGIRSPNPATAERAADVRIAFFPIKARIKGTPRMDADP